MLTPALPRARRRLLRAARLAAAGRTAEAVSLADLACGTLRRSASRDRRRRTEYANALTCAADLHVALMALPAALCALDALVDLLALAGTEPEPQASDRFADALIRRGDVLRLLARHDLADADLARAGRLATSVRCKAGAHNAAGILAKDRGRYDEAELHYRTALALGREVFGDDSHHLASVFHNLGGLEHARQRYTVGAPYARRAVALRERAWGSHSTQVAGDQAVLAALLTGAGLLAEAEELFDAALSTFLARLGPLHYEVGAVLHSLGALHLQTGRPVQALAEYEQALRITSQVLGGDHPHVRSLTADLDMFGCPDITDVALPDRQPGELDQHGIAGGYGLGVAGTRRVDRAPGPPPALAVSGALLPQENSSRTGSSTGLDRAAAQV